MDDPTFLAALFNRLRGTGLSDEQGVLLGLLEAQIEREQDKTATWFCEGQDRLWEALAERFPSVPILSTLDELSEVIYGN